MHVVDPLAQPVDERGALPPPAAVLLPVVRVQILDDVAPARGDVRPEELDARDLIGRQVTAVVDHDVEALVHRDEFRQELDVGLAPDVDLDARLGEFGDTGLDVDADDAALRTQVVAPHLQRSAVRHTDLEQRARTAPVRSEELLVDREVVQPLVDHSPVVVIEVPAETTVPST